MQQLQELLHDGVFGEVGGQVHGGGTQEWVDWGGRYYAPMFVSLQDQGDAGEENDIGDGAVDEFMAEYSQVRRGCEYQYQPTGQKGQPEAHPIPVVFDQPKGKQLKGDDQC
ncbi:hypothetical protein ABWL43_01285 [Pseudomonas sp. HT11]|uniref:hypothetical protein n=1 Tax=Pseudomonas sp. HT11 TaxID=3230490 RepID=UPI00384C2649